MALVHHKCILGDLSRRDVICVQQVHELRLGRRARATALVAHLTRSHTRGSAVHEVKAVPLRRKKLVLVVQNQLGHVLKYGSTIRVVCYTAAHDHQGFLGKLQTLSTRALAGR